MQDLIEELGIEAGSPAGLSPALSEDRYGSLYDLARAAGGEDAVSTTQTEPILECQASGPLSCATDLSADFGGDVLYQSVLQRQASVRGAAGGAFDGVLQSRFLSKHGNDSMGASQMTMVASCASVGDELRSEDVFSPLGEASLLMDGFAEAPEAPARGAYAGGAGPLAQYPLLSPSYASYLRPAAPAGLPAPGRAPAAPELTELRDPATSPLLQGVRDQITADDAVLYLNYRNCLRSPRTALPLSFQELKARIEQYGLDIQFAEEAHTADVKQMFLMPLNETTVPRWVPNGTSFRIGRSSNWFLGAPRVVSRNHCELFHDIHSYYVKDVGSRSGTYVNGTRVSAEGLMSLPRELKHGDILQIGVDVAAEADPYGTVPVQFRAGMCLALYGYKARPKGPEAGTGAGAVAAAPPPPATATSASMGDSKYERMARKAMALKSKMASASAKLFIEFGDYISDTSAGTAVLHRPAPGEPSYSFAFNNYRFSWDVSMTCRRTGAVLGMALESDPLVSSDRQAVYRVFAGSDRAQLRAWVTVQGPHKVLVEPVYGVSILDEQELLGLAQSAAAPKTPAASPLYSLAVPAASPYILAGAAGAARPVDVPAIFQTPVVHSASGASALFAAPVAGPAHAAPRNPFYTLTGDLAAGSLAFYVERYANTRAQTFLGEGQVCARKSQWGKKTILYEARLPGAEQNDDLLALATLFSVLNQLEKI